MSLILPKMLTEDALRATGIHIGVKGGVTKDMAIYVSEVSPAGNPLMDINAILNKLDVVGKHISRHGQDPAMRPLFYATDPRFDNALKSFNAATLIPIVMHRLVAGSLTNSQIKSYVDADCLVVSDPTNGVPQKIGEAMRGDRRAMYEASSIGIPVIAICNTNATFEDVDIAIPANNVGAKAIATVYYLLARSILLHSGWLEEMKMEDICKYETKEPLTIEDFETKMPEKEEEGEEE
jgi:small subunit ribosomal protein S2